MKRLVILLLLTPSLSYADWDDLYSCHVTNSQIIMKNGEENNMGLSSFHFKLDKKEEAMIFSKETIFGEKAKLAQGRFLPSKEYWFSDDVGGLFHYDEGKFLFSNVTYMGIFSVSADCEIVKIEK